MELSDISATNCGHLNRSKTAYDPSHQFALISFSNVNSGESDLALALVDVTAGRYVGALDIVEKAGNLRTELNSRENTSGVAGATFLGEHLLFALQNVFSASEVFSAFPHEVRPFQPNYKFRDVHTITAVSHDQVLISCTESNEVVRANRFGDILDIFQLPRKSDGETCHFSSVISVGGEIFGVAHGLPDLPDDALLTMNPLREGCLVNLSTRKVMVRGLSQPHSLTYDDATNEFLVCDSGARQVLVLSSEFQLTAVHLTPGYTRGIALSPTGAVVGYSKSRITSRKSGGHQRLDLETQGEDSGLFHISSGCTIDLSHIGNEIFEVVSVPRALVATLFEHLLEGEADRRLTVRMSSLRHRERTIADIRYSLAESEKDLGCVVSIRPELNVLYGYLVTRRPINRITVKTVVDAAYETTITVSRTPSEQLNEQRFDFGIVVPLVTKDYVKHGFSLVIDEFDHPLYRFYGEVEKGEVCLLSNGFGEILFNR